MALRVLIGVLVIGFGTVMTVLLVRMNYFPEESRLASEDPKLVMERFLSRTGTESTLDIWKGNEIVGILRIEPRRMPPKEMQRTGAIAFVETSGYLTTPVGPLGDARISLSSKLAMNLDADVKESQLRLAFDSMSLELLINQTAGVPQPHIVLKQTGSVLFDSLDAKGPTDSSQGPLSMLLGGFGLDPADLQKRRQDIQSEVSETRTEARRGEFEIMGQFFKGYILTATLGGSDKKFTLYFSDSGEIIQMKTFLDYRFISDGLRPPDAKLALPPQSTPKPAPP